MRLDVLADIFVARDGDATTASLVILAAVFALAFIVFAAMCRVLRHKRQRKWAERLAVLEKRAAANCAQIEREARIVGEIRGYVTGAAADSRPHLKVVKG